MKKLFIFINMITILLIIVSSCNNKESISNQTDTSGANSTGIDTSDNSKTEITPVIENTDENYGWTINY